MAGWAELFTENVTLSSRVDSLSGKVDTLARKVEGPSDRVIRREGEGDLNAERSKNAAMGAVVATSGSLFEKLARLEGRIDALKAIESRSERS